MRRCALEDSQVRSHFELKISTWDAQPEQIAEKVYHKLS